MQTLDKLTPRTIDRLAKPMETGSRVIPANDPEPEAREDRIQRHMARVCSTIYQTVYPKPLGSRRCWLLRSRPCHQQRIVGDLEGNTYALTWNYGRLVAMPDQGGWPKGRKRGSGRA